MIAALCKCVLQSQSDSRILNVYFMKTANTLVYGYITVYGYVLNY